MGKKFKRCLSVLLALMISSSSVIAVSADTADTIEPDVSNEPYTINRLEETKTDEFEVKSDVLEEADEEASTDSSDSKAKRSSSLQESKEPQSKETPDEAAKQEQKEKSAPEPSSFDAESASGKDGNITWTYDGNTKTLTISGEGRMRYYYSTGTYLPCNPWWQKDVEKVVIEKGITNIGGGAFESCGRMTEIIIPDTVTQIENYAFSQCSKLKSITIPENVTYIGQSAFYGCSQLSGELVLPKTLKTIGSDAFSGCSQLTGRLNIPNSVETISLGAFHGCSGFTGTLIIPDSVKSIGSHAFAGCSGLTGNITIPRSITSIEEGLFYQCTNITSITIPDSVTSIGYAAFSRCFELSEINIPDSVTSLGGSFLAYCGKLTNINIPDSVTEIGTFAFKCCTGLVSVKISNSLTSIEDDTFAGCSSLTSIKIPDSVTEINRGAFSGCKSLTKIEIPKSVTSIEYYVFEDCSGLTSITIPDSVTSIKNRAFQRCKSLTAITIPKSVTSIQNSAFSGCSNLTSVNISGAITELPTDIFSDCPKLTDIKIPNSVTTIGESAFKNCSGLTSIKIPDSVTTIGESAFENCGGLTSIEIPDSVTTIGKSAFQSCGGLTSIEIPKSVTSIGSSAFSVCKGLTEITLPDSITVISSSLFASCEALTNVNLPNSITKINSYAFSDCKGLTNINIPNSVTSIGSAAFKRCTGLTNISISNSVASIGQEAFYDCTGLTNINIPDSVTNIGSGAFSSCTSLTSIKIPDNVTSIESYLFSGCTGLKSITIPNSVTSIGSGAFSICTGLKSITIPNSVASIGSGAFSACTGLTNITIPNSVTSIESYLFHGCEKLTSIDLPDSLEKIGKIAFSSCTGLTRITIPNSVTNIDESAFQNCTSLKSVTLSDSLTSIGKCAFYYCTSLTDINIPDSVTSIGNSAFAVCTSLTNVKLSDSIDNIDYGTFERCSSLTSIVIPNSVTAINSSAFADCTSLTEINIPDSVTSINDSAFSGCSADLTIYCLPGSYAHEFAETNNIHYEFTYIGNSTAKLIVNVDDKYNGFYLTLTSGKTNKIFCNRIIDKERISVYGLNPAEKYKAQIVSDTGSVFGTVENIKFTDDLAQISFSDTKPICSINAVVKDGNNSDVTDLCSIKWYSANGTFIKAGTTLNNVAEGDEFKFRITFNSNILSESYVKPEEQTITVYDENNEVECTLESIEYVGLNVKVVDNDGSPIKNANIALTQTVNGIMKTKTAVTNNEGLCQITASDVSSKLVVKKTGYEIYSEAFDNIPEDVKTITIHKIETANIALSITKQELESEAEILKSYDGIDLAVTNKTAGEEIQGFSAMYPNLILPLNEVAEGDEITVKASMSDYIAVEKSFIYGSDTSVSIDLVQFGRLLLTQKSDSAKTNMALIFDNSGNYVKTLTMKAAKATLANLPEGDYTVIMMNKSYRYYSPSTLNEFNGYGLEENKDYVKSDVKIKNAKVTNVDNISVPVMDDTKSKYLDLDKTSITINRSSVSLGQDIAVSIEYAFNDNVDAADTKIDLCVPENFIFRPNCITVDNKITDYTNDNGNVSIPVEETSGKIRIALKAAASSDNCVISADMMFRSGDEGLLESIGAVTCSIKDFQFYVPERTNKTKIFSYGVTLPSSTVEYYDNDVLVGTTNSNSSGSFDIEFDLNKPFKKSTHNIYAVVTAKSGEVLKTSSKTLEYACDNICADKLNIYYSWHQDGVMTMYFNEKQKPLTYLFNPSYPTFTYELEIDGDASKVIDAEVITKTQNDEYIHVPLTLDKSSGKLVGSYNYTTQTRPASIAVSFDTQQEYIFDVDEINNNSDIWEEGINMIYDSYDDIKNEFIPLYEKAFNYKYTVDDYKELLKSLNVSDSEINSMDLQKDVDDINNSVNEYVKELGEEFHAENKDAVDAANESVKSDKAEDSRCFDRTSGEVVKIDSTVTAETLLSENYIPVKTYDNTNDLYFSENDQSVYKYVDLKNRIAVLNKTSDRKSSKNSPESSGFICCDDCDETKDYNRGFAFKEKAKNALDTLNGLLDVALNMQNHLHLPDGALNVVGGFNPINLINSYDKVLDAKISGLSIAKTDVITYRASRIAEMEAKIGKLEAMKSANLKYLGAAQKYIAGANYVAKAAELGSMALEFYDDFEMCECVPDDKYNEANKYIEEAQEKCIECAAATLTSIGIDYACNKNPYAKLGNIIVTSWSDALFAGYEIGALWGWYDDTPERRDAAQFATQPVKYLKRKAKENFNKAKSIAKSSCKCKKDKDGNPIRSGVDPSGYVCEAVSGNRIEGVTTTLYYSETKTGENAVIWDASEYDQINPLTSDNEGHYEWYVPEGWWQVKFEKAGYETAYSDWVPVLPIQTEINVSMKSLYAPTVKYVNAYSNAVDVTFSQYMDIETINSDTVKVSVGENQITGKLEPLNAEASFDDNSVQYASKFRFVPDTALSENVKVSVDKVKSYNGLYIDSEYTSDVEVKERIEKIEVPETVEMNYNESTEITIQLLPEKAAANVNINVKSINNRFLTVENSTVTTDENGKATVKIEGKLPSETEVVFSIDELDLKASTKVKLTMPEKESHNYREYMIGDIDDDKSITSADSLLILRRSVNIEKFTAEQDIAADADGDGNITSGDALYVLRYSVKLKDQTKIGETVMLEVS